ncbi:leucine-rich repeat receptor protein kinase [Spatholobus suberectus]|nr:leucine-rich repeat receptor protein kinase [Spatholobus suberectus]
MCKCPQVYKGTLPNGQLIAIKRAQKESMQGKLEFKAEIELLSRVHHKNLVSLVGFCFEQGEQMLIYEYVQNGSLKDALSGKSGIKLDWIRRLKLPLVLPGVWLIFTNLLILPSYIGTSNQTIFCWMTA